MHQARTRAAFYLLVALFTITACGEGSATPTTAPAVIATPQSSSTTATDPMQPTATTPPTATIVTADPTRTRRPLPATATPLVVEMGDVVSGATLDVCALLRQAGAAELLGEPSEPPAETRPSGGVLLGNCKWAVATEEGQFFPPQVLVDISRHLGGAADPEKVIAASLEDPADLEIISGLGDWAAWAPTAEGGWLVVLDGSNYVSLIAIKVPLEKARPLAAALLPLLPQ